MPYLALEQNGLYHDDGAKRPASVFEFPKDELDGRWLLIALTKLKTLGCSVSGNGRDIYFVHGVHVG